MSLVWGALFDPDEVKDYAIDWSELLSQQNDTIQTSTWELADDQATLGMTIDSSLHNDYQTSLFISNSDPDANRDELAGRKYDFINTITTVGLRTHQRTCKLTIKEL
jgi:hypothetical protein